MPVLGEPEAPIGPELPEVGGPASTNWARAVEWASENLHRKAVNRKTVGAMHYTIWQWAREDEKNKRDLLVNLMPRAVAILGKDSKALEDEAAAAEAEAVAEIDKLIAAAIKEAAT